MPRLSAVCRVAIVAALLVVCVASLEGVSALRPLQHRIQSARPMRAASTFQEYLRTGVVPGDADPLSQVRRVLDARPAAAAAATEGDEVSFVEVSTGVQKVHSFCEICILVMQMKERGEPQLCHGLNADHYVTCIEVLESLLRSDKALVYWLRNGCMHMDATGPEIVRPCTALSICSWVPNLFAQPPALVRDGVESLCPKDPKFLPTIPNEYKTLLKPLIAAQAGPNSGAAQ